MRGWSISGSIGSSWRCSDRREKWIPLGRGISASITPERAEKKTSGGRVAEFLSFRREAMFIKR